MQRKYDRDPDHWHRLATEARAQAAQMPGGEKKRLLLRIARGYDALAEQAEQRRKPKF